MNSEHDEQVIVCKYLDIKKIKYYSVPSGLIIGGKNKFALLNKFKREGYKNGVPDLVIFLQNKILYIEMKRQKGSATSQEQKDWIKFINEMPYAEAHICKGAKEAIEKINDVHFFDLFN